MEFKFQKYKNRKLANKKWTPHKKPNKNKYDFIISIPCYNEYDYLFDTLKSIGNQKTSLLDKTLVSIVINNRMDENEDIKNNNKKTYQKLLQCNFNFEYVIIDAFSELKSMHSKIAGVGLTRKISIDSIIKYCNLNTIICFIDADVILSDNYLLEIDKSNQVNNWGAATANFSHNRDEPKTTKLIDKYEFFLKSTAEKLNKYGSPYCYVSLGSTMLCTLLSYISVGGMNKRKAAEDFYFLQELEKYIGIYQIKTIIVYPSSRYAKRSYLGTSTRLQMAMDGKLNMDLLNYSNASYLMLQKWINLAIKSKKLSYKEILFKASLIDSSLPNFLNQYNFKNAWDGFKISPSDKHYIKQFHRWFDAFKTLKFLKKFT